MTKDELTIKTWKLLESFFEEMDKRNRYEFLQELSSEAELRAEQMEMEEDEFKDDDDFFDTEEDAP